MRETLNQENGPNHGYDKNRHRRKNHIRQPIHRIIFNVVFQVSFSLVIHACRAKMPTSQTPQREMFVLDAIRFAGSLTSISEPTSRPNFIDMLMNSHSCITTQHLD